MGLPEERYVLPIGHVKTPDLVLKMYRMNEGDSHNPNAQDTEKAIDFLVQEIHKGKVDPHSGIGFAIHSQGILNVCRWNAFYQDVVAPMIYTSDSEGIWSKDSVEREGAFCSGEKIVYDFENRMWTKYLASKRTPHDKIEYLSGFFQGRVNPRF